MPFYEIIYETGENSIAFYDEDAEAVSAVKAHHDRALAGEKFQTRSPQDTPAGPAIRIKRVFKYDRHPADLTEAGIIDTSTATAVIEKVAQGDLVSVHELTAAIRDELDPMVESAPHESNYKMTEVAELDPATWSGE